MMKHTATGLFVLSLAGVASAGLPQAVFDFEEADLQQGADPVTFFRGDQSLTLTPDLGVAVFEPGVGYPASWGSRSIDATLRPGLSLLMTFSPGITGVTFEFGSTGSNPATVLIEALGFNDEVLFGSVATLDNQLSQGAEPFDYFFSFLAPTDGLRGIRFTGLGDGSAFLALDNVTLTIPGPSGLGVLAAAGVLSVRRRRSS
jgi:hypothetical protein